MSTDARLGSLSKALSKPRRERRFESPPMPDVEPAAEAAGQTGGDQGKTHLAAVPGSTEPTVESPAPATAAASGTATSDKVEPTRSKPARPKASSKPAPAEEATAEEAPSKVARTTPKAAAISPVASRPAGESQKRVRVTVRLSSTLRQLLAAKATDERLTRGAAVLQAVETVYTQGRLAEVLGSHDVSAGGLFSGVRAQPEPEAPGDLNIPASDLAVLDDLVKEFGAKSRSHLVRACLSDVLH